MSQVWQSKMWHMHVVSEGWLYELNITTKILIVRKVTLLLRVTKFYDMYKYILQKINFFLFRYFLVFFMLIVT